ncbi:MAG TPA: hypothetical protein VII69_13685 [Candidatus Eremiobacteraceae bacterium]
MSARGFRHFETLLLLDAEHVASRIAEVREHLRLAGIRLRWWAREVSNL